MKVELGFGLSPFGQYYIVKNAKKDPRRAATHDPFPKILLRRPRARNLASYHWQCSFDHALWRPGGSASRW